MRLDKYLTELQIGTRSQVKQIIRKGSVFVNGEPVKKTEYSVDEANDTIIYNGKVLSYQKYQYFMLYKPAGVVTATKDNFDKTVLDLLPSDAGKGLFPVGRLDKDTEGLLLNTNDGELAHRLLAQKKHVEKTYYTECSGTISREAVARLEQGIDIGDDTPTKPAKVKILSQMTDMYTLELTITEGRFHQVKRMIAAAGGQVTYLKRIAMGTLTLDSTLEKGSYRVLTEQELVELKQL